MFENGRRYCNTIYHTPVDEQEQDRLRIVHRMYLLLFKNELFRAPIDASIERVLDIGAGTGDWAIAMAQQYPDAQITACDIGIFDVGEIPYNLRFELDDVNDEWSYSKQFDYIHLRDMAGAIRNWSALYEQAFENLSPGGHLEIIDWNESEISGLDRSDYLSMYCSAVGSAAEMSGYPRSLAHHNVHLLHQAGFEQTRTETLTIPIGTWHFKREQKIMGKMALVALLEGLEATSLRLLTKHKGWKSKEVKDLCSKVATEIRAEGSMAFFPVHITWAMKPHE